MPKKYANVNCDSDYSVKIHKIDRRMGLFKSL